MFGRLINQAKGAVTGLVLTYVARASVAVPFLIAFAFAVAAITAMLVEQFGAMAAYWMMAGGLAAVGAIAAVAVSYKEYQDEGAEHQAEATDRPGVASHAASQALTQAPMALLGTIFALPGGAQTALKAARGLGRHWPLVALAALIGLLFLPTSRLDETADAEARRLYRNGHDHEPDLGSRL